MIKIAVAITLCTKGFDINVGNAISNLNEHTITNKLTMDANTARTLKSSGV